MGVILLQLESALADARTFQERAAEKLHDTGVAHALAKSEYDAAAEAVRRVEGALNSMHGIAPPVVVSSVPPMPPVRDPVEKPRRERKPQEPACPACMEPGKLSRVMIGTSPFVKCGACNAEFPQ